MEESGARIYGNTVKVLSLSLLFVFLTSLCGCPGSNLGFVSNKEEVIGQLLERRKSLGVMEADVKFRFPEGVFFAASLEGHAVYNMADGGPMLRMVAYGPMGVQALDLLVRDGDFRVKVSGRQEPLGREDLIGIYGDGPLTRTPALLAGRPGLFFGGIPDDLDNRWSSRASSLGMWLTSPDGDSYLVGGAPPVIRRAVMDVDGMGVLRIKMGGWERAEEGVFPKKITVKFDEKTLFSFRIRTCEIGPQIPEGLFDMLTLSPGAARKYLLSKTF